MADRVKEADTMYLFGLCTQEDSDAMEAVFLCVLTMRNALIKTDWLLCLHRQTQMFLSVCDECHDRNEAKRN
ncbi:MAG: hypothetical protein ACI4SA_09820 [Lachnospiraceae bacterium]